MTYNEYVQKKRMEQKEWSYRVKVRLPDKDEIVQTYGTCFNSETFSDARWDYPQDEWEAKWD